jgi:hypothetical protein
MGPSSQPSFVFSCWTECIAARESRRDQHSPFAPGFAIGVASYVPQTDTPLMAVTLGSMTGASHAPLLGVVRSA